MGYLERRKHENSEKIAWLLSFVLIVSAVFGNVNLKAIAAGAATLAITIEDNTGVDGNYVEYSTNNGVSWMRVQSGTSYTLAEADTELAPNSQFKIRAVRGENTRVECSDAVGFTENDFGGITGSDGGNFAVNAGTAYSLKVSFMPDNGGSRTGDPDNFELAGASVSGGTFTSANGMATLKVGDTLYNGNNGKTRVSSLTTTIVVELTANEGKKGVLRFGGGSTLAFVDSMITISGQKTTYTFTLSGIGVTDLNTFVALNIDFEDAQSGGEDPGPGSTDAISLVIEGDAVDKAIVEYSVDNGQSWTKIETNIRLDGVTGAKVKVTFSSAEEDHAERYINKPSKIKAFRNSVTARSAGHSRNLKRKTE